MKKRRLGLILAALAAYIFLFFYPLWFLSPFHCKCCGCCDGCPMDCTIALGFPSPYYYHGRNVCMQTPVSIFKPKNLAIDTACFLSSLTLMYFLLLRKD